MQRQAKQKDRIGGFEELEEHVGNSAHHEMEQGAA